MERRRKIKRARAPDQKATMGDGRNGLGEQLQELGEAHETKQQQQQQQTSIEI